MFELQFHNQNRAKSYLYWMHIVNFHNWYWRNSLWKISVCFGSCHIMGYSFLSLIRIFYLFQTMKKYNSQVLLGIRHTFYLLYIWETIAHIIVSHFNPFWRKHYLFEFHSLSPFYSLNLFGFLSTFLYYFANFSIQLQVLHLFFLSSSFEYDAASIAVPRFCKYYMYVKVFKFS